MSLRETLNTHLHLLCLHIGVLQLQITDDEVFVFMSFSAGSMECRRSRCQQILDLVITEKQDSIAIIAHQHMMLAKRCPVFSIIFGSSLIALEKKNLLGTSKVCQ